MTYSNAQEILIMINPLFKPSPHSWIPKALVRVYTYIAYIMRPEVNFPLKNK